MINKFSAALILALLVPLTSCRVVPFDISWKENYWDNLVGAEDSGEQGDEAGNGGEVPGSELPLNAQSEEVIPDPERGVQSTAPEVATELSSAPVVSLFDDEPVAPAVQPTTEPSSIEPALESAANSTIELVWKVPETAVEGFVIRYGLVAGQLDQEIRVGVGQLEILEDIRHGRVYRYLLQGVPDDQVVYVSIAAFTGAHLSAPSALFEVAP